MEKIKIAEFSYDIHNALGDYESPEFDHLKLLGMAATLSIHIRGLGEIEYEVLKMASYYYFKIPSLALKQVIQILSELEFIDVIGSKINIKSIIPKIPHFKSIYQLIGDYTEPGDLNETELAMLAILNEISSKPENKQRLINSVSTDKQIFDTCFRYGESSGLLRTHSARGKEIILSPYYFADNLDGLADLTAKSGSTKIKNVLDKVKSNQGWPLSLVMQQSEIGGQKLDSIELSLIHTMASEGILKPPSISFGTTKTEQFIFTPNPGSTRLNASNREVYERAMALISCVRKGQLMPDEYKINWPLALLRSLRDKGYLKSNSEAPEQYKNLVFMKVANLIPTGGKRYQLKLINSEENIQAINIAIKLLEGGSLANLEVNKEARLSFSKDETYIQSIISSSEMRKRKQIQIAEEAKHEMDQLLLNLDI
ncbi:hypothetical protein [Pseudomonas sp. UBA2684]|uniref:hypothetical protein n=1 Tax=Pseudomonas sp. UBA2684 TaxID=1947311 RepID=UPI000E9E6C1B|nr:hypothetical protein [Pseudomonas sp. UBA2684]HBX56279.1 hypothetical protein [Pseudomonas sp.]|tara:strand:+ start:384 stop:1664 length:1281 start_codon:yes stop_codon:yes gene_type:complete